MKSSSKVLAYTGFIGALLVFCLIGLMLYLSMSTIATEAKTRKQSHIAIVNLENYFSYIKDAETGQRGYLLTNKEAYLEPYKISLRKITTSFKNLQNSIDDDPVQQKRLQKIHTLTIEKLKELENTIQTQKSKGSGAALQAIQLDHGKTLMDQIRYLIHIMEEEESWIYAKRDKAVEKSLRYTIIISMTAGIVALTLLAVTGHLLLREIENRQRLNQNLKTEITARKRSEAQINELNQLLEKQIVTLESTNKELEAFSYSVSHDLRAPLRSIDGFSKLLLSKANQKLQEDEQRYLTNICDNSQKMGELIDDLLKLSRLTRAEMVQESVNLSSMAKEILSNYQSKESARKTNIHVEDSIHIQGDSSLLKILIENLLNNAWKFTSHKEVTEIEVGVEKSNGKPIYYVRDNGAGFNMKYADKLFGVFQRLHRIDEFPGTGIGLATAQRIVHRHGGKIWAESAVEEGTTFYFSI